MSEILTDYCISFANKNENPSNDLIKKGLAEIKNNHLNLFIEKIAPELINEHHYQARYQVQTESSYLSYSLKEKDFQLCKAISKQLPDDVLKIECSPMAGAGFNEIFFLKNGKYCTKEGELLVTEPIYINANLCQDTGDQYKINLPIGPDGDLWKTLYLNKDCAFKFVAIGKESSWKNDLPDRDIPYRFGLYFPIYKLPVYSSQGKETMFAKDICAAYTEHMKEFSNKMSQTVAIEGLDKNNISSLKTRKDNYPYYIVKIPCPESTSFNGYLSLAVSAANVSPENGLVELGEKRNIRNARIEGPDGVKHIQIRNGDIEMLYNMKRSEEQVRETDDLEMD